MQITPEAFNEQFHALGLKPGGVALLLSVLKPMELMTGDHLINHGQLSDTLYFLCSGRLQMTIESGGVKLILGQVVPGRWVGDFGFIDPGEASATVTAEENSKVLALSQDGMRELYEESPDTASDLLQGLSLDLARRLRVTSRHVLIRDDENKYALQESLDVETSEDTEDTGLFSRIRKLLGISGGD